MSLKWLNTKGSAGDGDVSGPGSATISALSRWGNAAGTLLLDSGILVDNDNNISVDLSAASADMLWTLDPGVTNHGLLINNLNNGTAQSELAIVPNTIQGRVSNDAGANWTGYEITHDQGMRIFDGANEIGAFYHADYSAQGIAVKGDSWIPDVAFVRTMLPTFSILGTPEETVTILSADIAIVGSTYVIKDATGAASPAAPQTIETEVDEEIDGVDANATPILIEDPYGSLRLYSDGANLWSY